LTSLGVPLDAIRRGRTQEVVLRIADAFQRMRNPARRAALTQRLFGRTGRELLPLLMKGRQGIEEQLGMADKYGATLGTKSVEGVKEMIARQRELRFATMGVRVQLGTALMPILIEFSGLVIGIARRLSPLTRHMTALTWALAAVTAALVTYRGVLIASMIRTLLFEASLTATGVLMTGGVIVALIAIGAAVYLLVKHFGAVRKAAAVTWNWIVGHWRLLAAIMLRPSEPP
jgi:hypothetical protein